MYVERLDGRRNGTEEYGTAAGSSYCSRISPIDLIDRIRYDLGTNSLGPLLGLGLEGDLDAAHVAGIRSVLARAQAPALAGLALGLAFACWPNLSAVHVPGCGLARAQYRPGESASLLRCAEDKVSLGPGWRKSRVAPF